jgi:hypothetical protein
MYIVGKSASLETNVATRLNRYGKSSLYSQRSISLRQLNISTNHAS